MIISDEPSHNGFRPSGDILLNSIGTVYGKKALGVIMTGMGKDGVAGMRTIKENGGANLAQDEKTSTVFGMPKAAIAEGVVNDILPLKNMAGAILKYTHANGRKS